MNQYTELLKYLYQLSKSDVLENTTTQGDFEALDLDKMNIFPLVHINIASAGLPDNLVSFNVEIGCFNVRKQTSEIVTDKFWGADNEVDNMNETLAVLNRLWSKIRNDFDKLNITASENPTLTPQRFTRGNLLDGWIISFEVELPNIDLNLCQ